MNVNIRRQQSGFALIELIIVILIALVLAAIVIPMFMNARRNAVESEARVIARTYQNAVEKYRAATGGQVPPNPNPGAEGWKNAARGPERMLGGKQRRYLERVPEQVQSGTVHVGPTISPSASSTLIYATPRPGAASPNSYQIRVFVRQVSTITPICTLTEVTTSC